MIAPSNLYRIPRCEQPSRSEELRRYARLEHGAADLTWPELAAPAAPRAHGIRTWLGSHLGLARRAPRPVPIGPLASRLASVHFGGEGSRHTHVGSSTHPHEVLATSAFLVTVPRHEAPDEACVCEH